MVYVADRENRRVQSFTVDGKFVKQLLKGARPLVETDNKEVVTALREFFVISFPYRWNGFTVFDSRLISEFQYLSVLAISQLL